MSKTTKLIICTDKIDFDSMVSAALEKKGVSIEKKEYEAWSLKTCFFNFGDGSKLQLTITLIASPNTSFSLKVADAIKHHSPTWVGMIGSCSGKILGTTFIGFSSMKADRADVISAESVQDKLGTFTEEFIQSLSQRTDGYVQVPSYLLDTGILTRNGVNPHQKMITDRAVRLMKGSSNLKMVKAKFYSYDGIRDDCESELRRHAPYMNPDRDSAIVIPVALDKYSHVFFETIEYLFPIRAIPVIECVSHVGDGFLENKTNCEEFKCHFNQKLTRESQHLYKPLASQNAARCMMEFLECLVKLEG